MLTHKIQQYLTSDRRTHWQLSQASLNCAIHGHRFNQNKAVDREIAARLGWVRMYHEAGVAGLVRARRDILRPTLLIGSERA
jgi:hypothetical protein